MLLSPEQIREIADALIQAGLDGKQVRNSLLLSLPGAYTSGLAELAVPRDQVLSDLAEMNRAGFAGALFPLGIYLDNCASRANVLPQASLFRRLMAVAAHRAFAQQRLPLYVLSGLGEDGAAAEVAAELVAQQEELVQAGQRV